LRCTAAEPSQFSADDWRAQTILAGSEIFLRRQLLLLLVFSCVEQLFDDVILIS
jgi:hypothetical protein